MRLARVGSLSPQNMPCQPRKSNISQSSIGACESVSILCLYWTQIFVLSQQHRCDAVYFVLMKYRWNQFHSVRSFRFALLFTTVTHLKSTAHLFKQIHKRTASSTTTHTIEMKQEKMRYWNKNKHDCSLRPKKSVIVLFHLRAAHFNWNIRPNSHFRFHFFLNQNIAHTNNYRPQHKHTQMYAEPFYCVSCWKCRVIAATRKKKYSIRPPATHSASLARPDM